MGKDYGLWIFAPFTIIMTLIFAKNMQVPLNPYVVPFGMLVIVSIGALILFLFTIKHKLPYIVVQLILFAILAILSTYINGEYMDGDFLLTIISIVLWIFVYIASYIVTRKSQNSRGPFYIVALTLPFIAYLYYLIFQVQVNGIYYVLIFLPIILTLQKTYLKVFGIFVIFACVIVSLKRTALIAAVLAVFFYFFITSSQAKKQEHNIKNTLIALGVVLTVSIGVAYLYEYLSQYFNLDWLARLQALQTDGGSNRDIVWKTTINMQFNSTALEWLFGHGYNAVLRYSPFELSAHNDFLEVLFDYGLSGFAFYISFIISLFRVFNRMYRDKFVLVAQFASSLIIFLVMSTTSHLVIYPTYFIYLAFFWGVSIAQYENQKKGVLKIVQ
ncbi:O-antigen ligase family protein [Desulfitobacterium sp. THU1]|uniref:O-antigen ligase family protein n=1 Tax=Desulfitobacterium sp. THU1 TaxID=3138072 RepID=UPI00311FEDF5